MILYVSNKNKTMPVNLHNMQTLCIDLLRLIIWYVAILILAISNYIKYILSV